MQTIHDLKPNDRIETTVRTMYVQRLMQNAVECKDDDGRTCVYGAWNNLIPYLFLRVWREGVKLYERENK